MNSNTKQVEITRHSNAVSASSSNSMDFITIEEPLEILVAINQDLTSLGITMRTPGDEKELVIGLLYSEGIIDSYDDLQDISYSDTDNKVIAHLQNGKKFDKKKFQQYFLTNSSCGICGKAAIQALSLIRDPDLNTATASLEAKTFLQLPSLLKKHQKQFNETGGVHAVGLFTKDAELIHISEDIGRHNAMDKVIGYAIKNNINLKHDIIACTSSRASFELIQKTLVANINCFLAVGAPSSLAVELANNYQMTLVGFLKNDSFNIYSGRQRVFN